MLDPVYHAKVALVWLASPQKDGKASIELCGELWNRDIGIVQETSFQGFRLCKAPLPLSLPPSTSLDSAFVLTMVCRGGN